MIATFLMSFDGSLCIASIKRDYNIMCESHALFISRPVFMITLSRGLSYGYVYRPYLDRPNWDLHQYRVCPISKSFNLPIKTSISLDSRYARGGRWKTWAAGGGRRRIHGLRETKLQCYKYIQTEPQQAMKTRLIGSFRDLFALDIEYSILTIFFHIMAYSYFRGRKPGRPENMSSLASYGQL